MAASPVRKYFIVANGAAEGSAAAVHGIDMAAVLIERFQQGEGIVLGIAEAFIFPVSDFPEPINAGGDIPVRIIGVAGAEILINFIRGTKLFIGRDGIIQCPVLFLLFSGGSGLRRFLLYDRRGGLSSVFAIKSRILEMIT